MFWAHDGWSNYVWATVVSSGGLGFLLAALSSYFKMDLLPVGNTVNLIFVPQGVAMGFYGTLGILTALYLWLAISWDVGAGYNEFNKETGWVRVFRWGYPGKNRKIEISCRLEDVQSIRVNVRQGLNPKRALYLRIKGRGEVPINPCGSTLTLVPDRRASGGDRPVFRRFHGGVIGLESVLATSWFGRREIWDLCNVACLRWMVMNIKSMVRAGRSLLVVCLVVFLGACSLPSTSTGSGSGGVPGANSPIALDNLPRLEGEAVVGATGEW